MVPWDAVCCFTFTSCRDPPLPSLHGGGPMRGAPPSTDEYLSSPLTPSPTTLQRENFRKSHAFDYRSGTPVEMDVPMKIDTTVPSRPQVCD